MAQRSRSGAYGFEAVAAAIQECAFGRTRSHKPNAVSPNFCDESGDGAPRPGRDRHFATVHRTAAAGAVDSCTGGSAGCSEPEPQPSPGAALVKISTVRARIDDP